MPNNKHQFEATVHFSLSEQFKTIQNQGKLEETLGEAQCPVQTVTSTEITSDVSLKIYPNPSRDLKILTLKINKFLIVHCKYKLTK